MHSTEKADRPSNHLGLIAGVIDEIGIEEIINDALGIDEREIVTAGQIVKAIILNGLGFISRPLYLFPRKRSGGNENMVV